MRRFRDAPAPRSRERSGSSADYLAGVSVSVSSSTPEELLDRFGLPAFRLGQREAVLAALQGRDSLVVMPTGGGKSLCYQLPALVDDWGPTHPESTPPLVVVVSPLIALMDDQWRRLQSSGVWAVMLASGMPDDHNAQALRDIRSGHARLVLATPERFGSRAFAAALAARRVALFAVDEAHCIAEWGHDFRPDYLRLGDAIESLARPSRPPVMALTATATPWVTKEIAARLGLRDWVEVHSGFDRPNLTFDVVDMEGDRATDHKQTALMHILGERVDGPPTKPAIVYCGTRKETEQVALLLRGNDIVTVAYHAGMSPADRQASQRAFMDGSAEVVTATSAFGMGVDKAGVRTVIHWAIPTSLETYYQEAGRAGRDGEPARALMLASRLDLGRLIYFNTGRQANVARLKAYLGRLAARAPGCVVERGRPTSTERMLLSVAERSGALSLQRDARGYLRVELRGKLDTQAALRAVKLASDRGWESYRTMERFISNTSACRRRQILEHFGDQQAGVPTGRCCDVCESDEALVAALEEPSASRRRRARSRARGCDCGTRSSRSALNAANAAGADDQDVPQAVDGARFERLREWRSERAKGGPAFIVTSNAVLEDVLRTQPGSIDELREIRGIGPAFCEKHGESLLRTLSELGPVNAR